MTTRFDDAPYDGDGLSPPDLFSPLLPRLLILAAGALLLCPAYAVVPWWRFTGTDGIVLYVLSLLALCLTPVYGALAAVVIVAFRDKLFPPPLDAVPLALTSILAFLPVALLGLLSGVVMGLVMDHLLVLEDHLLWLVVLTPSALSLVLYVRWLLRRASTRFA